MKYGLIGMVLLPLVVLIGVLVMGTGVNLWMDYTVQLTLTHQWSKALGFTLFISPFLALAGFGMGLAYKTITE